jgi:ribosomal protein S18 acetylase RimI-like enzyme
VEIRSLAFRTDLALLAQSGSTVEARDGYLLVRTPDNPTFYWGNFLLLREAPEAAGPWLAHFEQELPDVRHRAFGLDVPDANPAALAPFIAAGLSVEGSAVLTTTGPVEARPVDAEVRPLGGDDDWAQRVELAQAVYDEGRPPSEFVVRRAAAERRRCEAGHGAWWGAFEGGRLLSACGIFAASPGLARYQDVETHPDGRRRGLAGAVVAAAGRHARESLEARTLVIVADPEYDAYRLYESLGFTRSETQVGAELAPTPNPPATR